MKLLRFQRRSLWYYPLHLKTLVLKPKLKFNWNTVFTENWQDLRTHLLSREGENWQVWTDWYERIIQGDPGDEELEVRKALIPDEDWKQGPAHVNAIIARMIAEHDKRTYQSLIDKQEYLKRQQDLLKLKIQSKERDIVTKRREEKQLQLSRFWWRIAEWIWFSGIKHAR